MLCIRGIVIIKIFSIKLMSSHQHNLNHKDLVRSEGSCLLCRKSDKKKQNNHKLTKKEDISQRLTATLQMPS